MRPPEGVRVEAGVYWQLLGETGLVKVRAALDEVAREIAFFTAAAEPVGPLGIDLKAGAAVESAALEVK